MTGKLFICGEAFGEQEEKTGLPFQGASGWLLDQLLSMSGLSRSAAYVTNVFNLRPAGNDVTNFCGPKSEGIPGIAPLKAGKYIRAEFLPEIKRLEREIERERPTLILALGNTPAAVLLGTRGISEVRGAAMMSKYGIKVFPTFHPAAILREYGLRPIVLSDLSKVRKELEFPEIRRPSREIWLDPTFDDLLEFERRFIAQSPYLSVDIETSGRQITCIGFAPSRDRALVVPITCRGKAGGSYWPHVTELRVWDWIRKQCQRPEVEIIGQNFMYDLTFLWTEYGIPVKSFSHDTMLMHHALQPEMRKGLGFLASIYTNEQPWKTMRHNDTNKKED